MMKPVVCALLTFLLTPSAFAESPLLEQLNRRMARGETTRIVCFGDSITGVYYHTGGLRAWCDMLGLALQKSHPRANLEMINAGISGHTTVNALSRIERDVISKQPHLVVVMFGMNDVARVALPTYRDNMTAIVKSCQAAGAAVVLCTPNSVSENTARPEDKLARYADAVRDIARKDDLPLVDCFRDWQDFRKEDPTAWSLMMSDAIHPNMIGHARVAEMISERITGRRVSVATVETPFDGLQHTFDRLSNGESVRLVAMPPWDTIVPDILRKRFPEAELDVVTWPTKAASVSDLANWAKQIRGMKPNLVIPAVPANVPAEKEADFVRDYEWVLNYSFQFAGRPWDVVPILTKSNSEALQQQERHSEQIIRGKDVRFAKVRLEKQVEDFEAWLAQQKRVWMGLRNRLPARNGKVRLPAQSWPHRPGPRTIRVSIHYPKGKLANVGPDTGIMLTLHNWGGEDCVGTADPDALANNLNVIAVCVNYLQSGRNDSVESPEPYDCGYLQSLDALRALAFVRLGLQATGKKWDDGRLYCTGGSGGGNVTLMANKLAPRTFACVIDMCGMKKLSDDIAFHLPGGSGLNARWNQHRNNPNFLSTDEQEIRFVGNTEHLALMKSLNATSKIIVIHGRDDTTCPFEDAQELVTNLQSAKLDVEHHFIGKDDLDGRVFSSSGHSLGNRTEIVLQVAGKYLQTDSPDALRRDGPGDFDRKEDIRYPTTNGTFVISFKDKLPTGSFIPASGS